MYLEKISIRNQMLHRIKANISAQDTIDSKLRLPVKTVTKGA